jgi:hypothetical protein
MEQKEFDGNLERIDPDKIIKEGNDNKVGSFFVGLGMIFNDLKDLILFEQLIVNDYRLPNLNEECSDHSGNYCGIMVHINKLFAGAITEFFIFIKENRDILNDAEFKNIFEKLSETDKRTWNGLVAASNGQLDQVSDFVKNLIKIRSNLSYHYYQSGKMLSKGFISKFKNEQKDKRNENAYYSIDDTMEKTRFYFSDAAVEEALYIEVGKEEKKKIKDDPNIEKYREQMKVTIHTIIEVIRPLMKKFLQSRRNNQ